MLRVPRRSSHPAAVACVIARRDTSEPLPFWVVSTVSVQAAPGLTPSIGSRGRKSRKFPRSWTTDCATTLSDARAFTNSPRGATRPADTSFRTFPARSSRRIIVCSLCGTRRGRAVAFGAAEDSHHLSPFACDAQQFPAALPHIGAPPDELLPLLRGGAEYPQVRDLLPLCRVRFRRRGHREVGGRAISRVLFARRNGQMVISLGWLSPATSR